MRLASEANPLVGPAFYVNPESKVMRAANGASSPELTAIANTPTAYWMDHRSTPAVDAKYIATAQAAGTMPILALYGIPNRDCGSSPPVGSGRRVPTAAGSTVSQPRSAEGLLRSSSNPTRSPWPTASRLTSSRSDTN